MGWHRLSMPLTTWCERMQVRMKMERHMRRGGEGRQHCTFLLPKVLPYSGACSLWHSEVILSVMSSPLGWNIILLQNWPERGWFVQDRSMSHVQQGKMMTGQGKREPFKRIQALKRQPVQKTMKVSSNPEVLQFYIWIGPMEKILIHMRNKELPWWLRWWRCLQCQETWVRYLGQEDTLKKELATHSSILTWRIPWTEEPGGLQSTGSQRVRHDWVTNTFI